MEDTKVKLNFEEANFVIHYIMAATLKTIVSKRKIRHREGKFDLDLTYITTRIIAMGYPAEKVESIYRNDYHTVKEFLDKKHQSHYWVYNLCSEKERIYDKKKFEGRVTCYPFDDHHPPNFSEIQPFCNEVKKYLEEDERNVAVVHCKAGKGRTGVMICCYLLYSKHSSTAETVLKFYGEQRTTDQKGVTIPSQRRYITYYDAMIRRGLEYKPVKLYLKDIVLDPMPNFATGSQCYIYFEVTQRGRKDPYVSRHYLSRKGERNASLSVNPPLLLSEDVKFEFITKPKFEHFFGGNSKMQKLAKGEKVFHFWLNTFFVDMELEGGLAHDLTASNPIEGQRGHVHHASGSSEDSSTDADIPLKPAQQPVSNGLCEKPGVTFSDVCDKNGTAAGIDSSSSASEMTNLMKHASISDDHLLQDRKARQTDSKYMMGPLSTSDESNEAADYSSTTESFIQRLRHTSMPQPRVSSGLQKQQHGVQPQPQQHHHHNHHHHQQLESSLSHAEVSSRSSHHFFSRPHATISSNSAASLEMASGGSAGFQVPIPGKLLSLRLKKGQIDKAHKDKSCRTFPDNYAVTLFLLKPEDQSENLLDYSLYSPALIAGGADSHSTITGSGYASLNSSERQFTVVPVSSATSLDSSSQPPQPPRPPNNRTRPLTGGSGASSSSATPSLKSTEQSSQDSVASSDGEADDHFKTELKPCLKHSSRPRPSAVQPQSTAI